MSYKKCKWVAATSSIALAFGMSAQAAAQTTDGTAGPANQNGEAAELVDESDVIRVTGFRASLARSQDIKKNAATVVEAVTLEDLGQFTDDSVADALRRVPGVQIQRNDNAASDGGDRVSIRGLGPQFAVTTVNGRLPVSAGSEGVTNLREFNFDVLPTEIISGLLVYKAPVASIVEPGLGGSVDVQTLRPLDTTIGENGKNLFAVANVRYEYDSLADDGGPRLSGIVGIRNEDRTFGAYISGIYSDSTIRRDEGFYRTAAQTLTVGTEVFEDVIIPNSITYAPIVIEQERLGLSGGLQFVLGNFEINADVLYSSLDQPQDRNQFQVDNRLRGGTVAANAATISNNQLQGYDGRLIPQETIRFNRTALFLRAKTENFIGGLNVKYENDGWKGSLDYSYSKVDFLQDLSLVINLQGRQGAFGTGTGIPELADAIFDGNSAPAPGLIFTGPTPNLNNPASYGFGGQFQREFQNQSDRHSFAADFGRDFGNGFSIDVGVHYDTTDIDVREVQPNFIRPAGVTDDDVRAVVFSDQEVGILTDSLPEGAITTLPALDFAALRAIFAGGFDATGLGTPLLDSGDIIAASNASVANVSPIAGNFFQTQEDTLAFYAQLNFDAALGELPFQGNLGLRAVRTDVSSIAFSGITVTGRGLDVTDLDADGNTTEPLNDIVLGFTPTFGGSDYWNFLPSLNLKFDVGTDTALRFGLSKVMSRPTFRDQVPFNTLIYNVEDQSITGSAGNGALDPYTANQIDLTLEHYTSNDGALYLSVFYKDISDFIIRQNEDNATIDAPFTLATAVTAANTIQQGGALGAPTSVSVTAENVSLPVNFSDAKVYGFELGLNQPFTFLPSPWDGFGVQANYTYVDGSFAKDVGDGGFGFPGSSKHNINAVGYYEKGPLQVRLAYSYRDEYLRSLGGIGDRRNLTFTEAQQQLDLSVIFDVTDRFQVLANVINITEEDRRDFQFAEENFLSYVERGRTFVVGARFEY